MCKLYISFEVQCQRKSIFLNYSLNSTEVVSFKEHRGIEIRLRKNKLDSDESVETFDGAFIVSISKRLFFQM